MEYTSTKSEKDKEYLSIVIKIVLTSGTPGHTLRTRAWGAHSDLEPGVHPAQVLGLGPRTKSQIIICMLRDPRVICLHIKFKKHLWHFTAPYFPHLKMERILLACYSSV